jgi:iron-sulfur cluster repair protein YtfE (RIC family)
MADMHGAPGAVWAFTEHEHQDLIRGIDRIHDVACKIDGWVTAELSVRVLGILAWLEDGLEPHISWEESWLYPQIDALTGTPWATRAARFDHRQIRDMAARVRADRSIVLEHGAREQLAELRCDLFSLEALLRAHVEREERYLIPLLAEEGSVAASAGSPAGPEPVVARSAVAGVEPGRAP